MWYDWMVGGWGGRNGKDGSNATAPIFGVGLAVQPLEGQERLCPVLTTGARDPAPTPAARASFRGGCGVEKGGDPHRGRGARSCPTVRPRALDHLGHRGRAAVDPARRLAEPRHGERALPRRRLLQRARAARATLHAPVGRRRRLRRPARARPRGGAGGRRRRLRLDRPRAQGLRRRRARGRRRARRVRGRRRGDRRGAGADPRRARRLARGGSRVGRRSATAPASSTCSTSSAATA